MTNYPPEQAARNELDGNSMLNVFLDGELAPEFFIGFIKELEVLGMKFPQKIPDILAIIPKVLEQDERYKYGMALKQAAEDVTETLVFYYRQPQKQAFLTFDV